MLLILWMLYVGVSTVFLLCGGVLWMRRHDGDRSRCFLAYTWLLVGCLFLVRLPAGTAGLSIVGQILPIGNLSGGLVLLVFLCLYPLEIIDGAWLNRKRAVFFFLPGVFMALSLWIVRPFACELYSFADIGTFIGEFNVWYRLLVLLLGVAFYSVLPYFIFCGRMKTVVCRSWIVSYMLKVQVVSILFMVCMLTGSVLAYILCLLVWIMVGVTSTYRELFIRFEKFDETLPSAEPEVLSVPLADAGNADGNASLADRLSRLMNDEEVWRNPDLSLSDLAQLLHTNRSYLSKAIQYCGYKNFSDLMNRRRIAEFLKLADAGRVASVQDTFFYVGFRSRETALRCFKKYVGMSPTDYLRAQTASREIDL